jgi:hypothetical protein
MPGAGLRERACRKALSDMLALKPYRGKPAVRNFRGGNGNVGIIRSPVRAIALLDHGELRSNVNNKDKMGGRVLQWTLYLKFAKST